MFRSLKTLRSIPRLKDIAFVLGRHGFYQVAGRLQAPLTTRWRRWFKREPGHVVEQPERLRLVLEDLGPTFIKFGQLLSTRPDIVPPAYMEELGRLQDEVQAVPFREIRSILDEEFDGETDRLFREIDPEPLAAASIAQVHRATTTAGDDVVIKVRRRGLEKIVEQDLLVLGLLVDFLSGWRGLELFDPEGVLRLFERSLRRELDFTNERVNLQRLRQNLPEGSGVYVPRAFPELSTSAVLTMERIVGEKLSSYQRRALPAERGQRAARSLASAFLKQIFEDRLYHADAHPGNLILLDDGRVALVDAGNVGRLTQEMTDQLVLLLVALVRQDYRGLARWILVQGRPEREIDADTLAMELMDHLDPYYGLGLEDIRIGELFGAFFAMILRHGIRVPPQYVAVGRTFMILEGAIRTCAPSFDVVPHVKPYVRQILRARWSPRRISREVQTELTELAMALRGFPARASEILTRAAEGRLRLETHSRDIEGLGRRLETLSVKVPLAIIAASLVLASAGLLAVPQTWQEPVIWGLSWPQVFGVFGLVVGVPACVGLLFR